jgi:hypothetical protein
MAENNITMSDVAIKLAVIGMDHRSQLLFTKTVVHQLRGICRIVDVQEADAVLFDMDSANSEEYWNSLKDNYPEMPVIALSIRPVNEKNTIYLRKPIKIPSLITTLRILFPKRFSVSRDELDDAEVVGAHSTTNGRASSAATTTIANTLNSKTNEATNVVTLTGKDSPGACILDVFDPSVHLIHHVMRANLEAKTLKKLVRILLWNGQSIIFNFSPNAVTTDIAEGKLRSLAIMPLNQEQTKIQIEDAKPEILDIVNPQKNASFKTHSAEAFIWQLALFTARGRVPLELQDNMFFADKPIYMEHWPNLTRLAPTPCAQQMTALLVHQPRSIKEISLTLNVPASQVASFFFAAAMIGCAGQAKRPSDKLFAPFEVKEHKNRKVLSAIMNKLRNLTVGNAQSA